MTCSNIVGVDVDSHRVADLWITGVYPVNNFLAVDKCKNWELSTSGRFATNPSYPQVIPDLYTTELSTELYT